MLLIDSYGQEIDFTIPEQYTKLAVNCSGGADSSILLYLVAKYLKDNNRTNTTLSVLTCANDFKHRWNARKAADIINYVIDELEWNQFDMHYAYYRDVQDYKYFHEVEEKLFSDNRIDLIISGITSNPTEPGPVFIEDSSGNMVDIVETGLDDRNTGGIAPTLEQGKWYMPFVNVDKRFVAAMYEQNNVMDMFDMTRSCEAIPNGKYKENFEFESCGSCWWCLERKWAFGRC
jgi:hypothetical protein